MRRNHSPDVGHEVRRKTALTGQRIMIRSGKAVIVEPEAA
jgi:hypothetical protein